MGGAMAPCVASSRHERARCVWRARKSLADAFADEGYSSAQVLQRRLQRTVREALRQVQEDGPMWSTMPGEASRLKVPRGYFTDFVEQIVRTLNRFSEHEAGERVAEYQRRLDEHTQA